LVIIFQHVRRDVIFESASVHSETGIQQNLAKNKLETRFRANIPSQKPSKTRLSPSPTVARNPTSPAEQLPVSFSCPYLEKSIPITSRREQMDFQKPFTVADVLTRPLFQHAKVVAGAGGLSRPVRWVHVLEVSDAASFVHGQELILTTGIGLENSGESALQFVHQLVECQVSGLCIELGKRFTEVPAAIRRYADECDFPIIVFEKEIRFIDITQDIHAYIINRHHHQILELEAISNRFLELTLRPQGIRRILALLHEETGCPVRLRDESGTDIVVPEGAANGGFQGNSVLCQPIIALDMLVGELQLAHDGKSPEFLQLILDRAATAIAQEKLRRLSVEERRLRKMQSWITDWLHHGVCEVPSGVKDALKAGGSLVLAAIRADHAEPPPSPDSLLFHEDLTILQWTGLGRNALEPFGLQVWLAPQGELWAAVLADRQPSSSLPLLQRVRKGFASLFGLLAARAPSCRLRWTVGISRSFRQVSEAREYWKQAKLALKVGKPPTSDSGTGGQADTLGSHLFSLACFDDLHAWQLFLQVNPAVLAEYIRHQIGPLLDYDRENGTELVRTLETFFAVGQSKQQAAKALYIHRQTLYYRLEQISSLLGNDWESPARRLALATALAAHRFLSVRSDLKEKMI
jgi:purine catabolism regulator